MEMRMRKSGNGEMRKWKHTCDDPWIIIIMAELDRQSWRIGFILSQLVVWPARLLTWLASLTICSNEQLSTQSVGKARRGMTLWE